MGIFVTLSFHVAIDFFQEIPVFIIAQVIVDHLQTITLFREQLSHLGRTVEDVRRSGNSSEELKTTSKGGLRKDLFS